MIELIPSSSTSISSSNSISNNDNIKKYIDPIQFRNMLLKATILPIALSILICVLFTHQFSRIVLQNKLIRQSDIFLTRTLGTTKLIIDAETGLRGYLITGSEEFLEPFNFALKKYYPLLDELKIMSVNKEEYKNRIDSIAKSFEIWLLNAKDNINIKKKFNEVGSLENFQYRKGQMDQIRKDLDSLYNLELTDRQLHLNKAQNVAKEALGIIIICGVFFGSISAFFSFKQLNQISMNYKLVITSLSEATVNLEEKITARTQDLIAVNQELEAFSYSVSHDLRAPLRGIDGFSQILVEEYSDKLNTEALSYLNFIRQGVQKMGQLIDDLINLSRLTRAEFKVKEIDISLIASEIMNELTQDSPKRKLIFKNFDSELLPADPGLLKIALQNLISNSWKYTLQKEVTKIELGKKIIDNKSVFYIKDNGIGFDMKYVDKLFQPFQRLHAKEAFAGTGIGLAIVGRVIKRHGGRIWAESIEGEGSTFYFTLSP